MNYILLKLEVKAEAGNAVPGRSVGRRFFGLSAQKWMKKEEVIAIIMANLHVYDEPA